MWLQRDLRWHQRKKERARCGLFFISRAIWEASAAVKPSGNRDWRWLHLDFERCCRRIETAVEIRVLVEF